MPTFGTHLTVLCWHVLDELAVQSKTLESPRQPSGKDLIFYFSAYTYGVRTHSRVPKRGKDSYSSILIQDTFFFISPDTWVSLNPFLCA